MREEREEGGGEREGGKEGREGGGEREGGKGGREEQVYIHVHVHGQRHNYRIHQSKQELLKCKLSNSIHPSLQPFTPSCTCIMYLHYTIQYTQFSMHKHSQPYIGNM